METTELRTDLERRICGTALAEPEAWLAIRHALPDVPFADRLAAVVRHAADAVEAAGGKAGLQEVTVQVHSDGHTNLPEAWWSELTGWVIASTGLDLQWACRRLAELHRNDMVSLWSARIASEKDRERRDRLLANPPSSPKALNNERNWREIVVAWGRDFEGRASGRIPPPPQHGLFCMDDSQGGCWAGDLEIIAGESGGGKTLALLQIGARMASEVPVVYASYEMPAEMVAMRLVAHVAELGPRKIRNARPGDDYVVKRVGHKLPLVAGLKMHFLSQPTLAEIAAKVAIVQARVVLFDYVQRAAELNSRSREEAVASVSSGLKQLALKTGTTVIAGSQVNDEGRLRESRAIGHDADAVFFLDEHNVRVGKSRYSPAGTTYAISIDFEAQRIVSQRQ